jgi:hypothetical protein
MPGQSGRPGAARRDVPTLPGAHCDLRHDDPCRDWYPAAHQDGSLSAEGRRYGPEVSADLIVYRHTHQIRSRPERPVIRRTGGCQGAMGASRVVLRQDSMLA